MQLLPAEGARVVRGAPVGLLAFVARCGGEVGAEAAHGIPDAPADLVGDEADAVGQTRLDALEVAFARGDLCAAGVGDLVDGLASVDRLGHEPLFLELREPRVDGAGRGRVGAAGALGQGLHEVVAVARSFGEQAEDVKAQVAVGEDGAHHHSSSPASSSGRSPDTPRRRTVISPETVFARTSTKDPASAPVDPV
mgnify:CR=1 FL=1